jgi:hypothetical protein
MALHTFVAGDVLEAQQLNDSFAAVGGFKVVKAETAFSAVASVTADSIFTSAYTNYRIIIRFQQSAGQLGMQFRASAVDTTSNYNYQTFTSSSTTNTGARATAQAQALIGNNSGGAFWQLSTVDLTGVQLAEPTVYHSLAVRNDGAYTVPSAYTAFGNQSDSTAFDGIKILTTSGTITGSYTIYGYAKA